MWHSLYTTVYPLLALCVMAAIITINATVEGQGWPPHAAALTNASTESGLVTAFADLHVQLLSGECFANESAVKTCCMHKYSSAAGSIWTRAVAQGYLRCMNTFATPVIPTLAYAGQCFPPPYLFTPPPSALIPVVPVPAPIFAVADAIAIPIHNDAAWGTISATPVAAATYDNDGVPLATSTAAVVVLEGKSSTASTTVAVAAATGDAMWVSVDKTVTTEPAHIQPVPFVYAPPADGSACWVNDGKIPIAVAQVQQPIRVVPARVQPKPETTLDMYKDGDETSTDVWCTPEEQFDTTHLNLWNNDISQIEGLHKFPNLLRLTLRSNEVKTLNGVADAHNLRWLDVSDNDVHSLKGLEGMSSLEWLDVHNNEFTSLDGMGMLPQLTFLNMRHSDLKNLHGIEKMLPRMRYIDVSSNDLRTVQGLERCTYLTEINLNSNDLNNFNEIKPLLRLPYLKRLDLSNNLFSNTAIRNLRKFGQECNPGLEIVCNSSVAGAKSGGEGGSGASGSEGCCAVQ